MATETKRKTKNQTWDYAKGTPIREEVNIYLMKDLFSARPVAETITFQLTFYDSRSIAQSDRNNGYTHRLIGIYGHEDGPELRDLMEVRYSRWGTQSHVKDSLRAAIKMAIADKLGASEEQIQHLNRIIAAAM